MLQTISEAIATMPEGPCHDDDLYARTPHRAARPRSMSPAAESIFLA